ncbi:unnamed protein product [Arctogadus glacialis]
MRENSVTATGSNEPGGGGSEVIEAESSCSSLTPLDSPHSSRRSGTGLPVAAAAAAAAAAAMFKLERRLGVGGTDTRGRSAAGRAADRNLFTVVWFQAVLVPVKTPNLLGNKPRTLAHLHPDSTPVRQHFLLRAVSVTQHFLSRLKRPARHRRTGVGFPSPGSRGFRVNNRSFDFY